MTTYNYTSNPNVVFNPNTDVLLIDTGSTADLFVSQSGANIIFVGGGHTATLQGVSPGQLTSTNVKSTNGSLFLMGDNTTGTTNDDLGNALTGGGGNDLLIGLGGNDTLDGGAGLDRIYGNIGDDSVRGSSGNDIVFGGQGKDSVDYFGQTGATQIYGNLGDDQLFGGAGSDSIFGGQGNDSLNAGDGNNRVFGGFGNDTVFGGNGDDRLEGGDGNDQLAGGFGANAIYGNQGDDTIGGPIGSKPFSSTDAIFGGQGNDSILYQNSTDPTDIQGNLGNDTVQGGSHHDFIHGGQGDDSIRGNGRGDVLNGGLGNDTFVVAVSGSVNDTHVDDPDVIDGFTTGLDKIRGLILGSDVPGTANNYNEFVDTDVQSSQQVQASYIVHVNPKTYTYIVGSDRGYLVIDANIDGTADGTIVLNGLKSLSDFSFTDII